MTLIAILVLTNTSNTTGKAGVTGQKKGHEKQERYEIQDKKGKYLNIQEVTDVIV